MCTRDVLLNYKQVCQNSGAARCRKIGEIGEEKIGGGENYAPLHCACHNLEVISLVIQGGGGQPGQSPTKG